MRRFHYNAISPQGSLIVRQQIPVATEGSEIVLVRADYAQIGVV